MSKRNRRIRRARRARMLKLVILAAFALYALGTVWSASAQMHTDGITPLEMNAARATAFAALERSHGECEIVASWSDEPSYVAQCDDLSVWAFDPEALAVSPWGGCRIPLYPGERRPGWSVSMNLGECYG